MQYAHTNRSKRRPKLWLSLTTHVQGIVLTGVSTAMSVALVAVPLVYYFGSQALGAGTPDLLETAAAGLVAPLGTVALAAGGRLEQLGDGVMYAPPVASAAASYLLGSDLTRAAVGAAATFALYPKTDQPGPSCTLL